MAKNATPKALLEALNMIRGTDGPKLESLSAVPANHVRRVRRIFEDRNIVGVGISEKETEKKATGELGLTFYVEKKLAKSKINPNVMIPPVISTVDQTAIFTDVQQIGKLRPQVLKRKQPLQSGYSVGNKNETGTLGAIVKKGTKYFVLSNAHVLADSGKGKKGDEIFFPGDADTAGKLQHVGALSEFVPFEKTEDLVNRVDAALAEIDGDFEKMLDFSILGVKSPLRTAAPVRDMAVVVRGRTSGDSEGVVKDVNFSVVIPYPGVGRLGFIDQVLCTRYSKPGDSGAIVVDKKSGRIVGLHIAGSEQGSIFNPIAAVVDALKFRFTRK